MRTVMRKRDLTKKLGFPHNIDKTKKIAVIVSPALNHIMYYTKGMGYAMLDRLPNAIEEVFEEGIYFVTKE